MGWFSKGDECGVRPDHYRGPECIRKIEPRRERNTKANETTEAQRTQRGKEKGRRMKDEFATIDDNTHLSCLLCVLCASVVQLVHFARVINPAAAVVA
jgi:hypothetical protein